MCCPQLDLILPETKRASIEVWTTLDVGMQRAATAAVAANCAGEDAQGALVSLDRDGAILALVGGTDYVESNFNRATDAMRQPGSSWKLFVYLAALGGGIHAGTDKVRRYARHHRWLEPAQFQRPQCGRDQFAHLLRLFDQHGRSAIGNEVGFGTVASMARRFGISSPVSTFPSMVLGASEVRLLEMTQAFAGISARGMAVEPYGISKVVTADGETSSTNTRNRAMTKLVPDYVAAGITDLLQAAVQTGTGQGRANRAACCGQDRHHQLQQGWLVCRLLQRDHHRRVDGPRRCESVSRACKEDARQRAPLPPICAMLSKTGPIEEFDTELNLPEWQLEPDEEALFGDPDDYYFIDEQGNLIEPGRRDDPESPAFDVDGEQRATGSGFEEPPPAASDDFLEEAIGGLTAASPIANSARWPTSSAALRHRHSLPMTRRFR